MFPHFLMLPQKHTHTHCIEEKMEYNYHQKQHYSNNNNAIWETSWNLVNSSSSNLLNSNYSMNNNNYVVNGNILGHHPDDPQLTCLNLGKRNYVDPQILPAAAETKKSRGCGVAAAVVVPPRCQVDGCEAVLVNAKDYHKRHKVCEIHAKSPKVLLLGIEQRFCQQCSRFHVVGEFDEAKRSCRRRLAGHNERRRKISSSSQDNTHYSCLSTKHSLDMMKMMSTSRRHPPHSNECALSLLSSTNNIPASGGAALHQLIAENRATRHQFLINTTNHKYQVDHNYFNHNLNHGGSIRTSGSQLTLELMQSPTSAFGLLSENTSKELLGEGQECSSELWKLPLG